MSVIQKQIGQFLSKPRKIKYRYLVKILKHFGFRQIYTKGSHVKFKHPKLPSDLVIPVHKNECKDFYKIQAYKQLKEIMKSYDNKT